MTHSNKRNMLCTLNLLSKKEKPPVFAALMKIENEKKDHLRSDVTVFLSFVNAAGGNTFPI